MTELRCFVLRSLNEMLSRIFSFSRIQNHEVYGLVGKIAGGRARRIGGLYLLHLQGLRVSKKLAETGIKLSAAFRRFWCFLFESLLDPRKHWTDFSLHCVIRPLVTVVKTLSPLSINHA
jgi:hypothetical protein